MRIHGQTCHLKICNQVFPTSTSRIHLRCMHNVYNMHVIFVSQQSAIQLHFVEIDSDHAYNNGSSLVIKAKITSPGGKPANVR